MYFPSHFIISSLLRRPSQLLIARLTPRISCLVSAFYTICMPTYFALAICTIQPLQLHSCEFVGLVGPLNSNSRMKSQGWYPLRGLAKRAVPFVNDYSCQVPSLPKVLESITEPPYQTNANQTSIPRTRYPTHPSPRLPIIGA